VGSILVILSVAFGQKFDYNVIYLFPLTIIYRGMQ